MFFNPHFPERRERSKMYLEAAYRDNEHSQRRDLQGY